MTIETASFLRAGQPWPLVVLLPAWSLACGCDASPALLEPSGEVGVFYGGQVQELETVELSSEKPKTVGFRVLFPRTEEAGSGHRVRWKIVRPGPAGRRVAETGAADVAPGRERLDQVIEMPTSAKLGTYNVRVLVDGKVVVDRAMVVRRSE